MKTGFKMSWLRLFVSLCVLPVLSSAAYAQTEGRAVVRDDVPVYSRPSSDSTTGAMLKKGDLVTVELELETSAGNWCAIRQELLSLTGYVPCEGLERTPDIRKFWERTTPSAPPEPLNERDKKPPEG